MTAKERKRIKKRRKKTKRRAEGNNINCHHIQPRSRGGKDTSENLAYIDMYLHRDYHKLFDNKTPDEIINYLIDYFWNGNTGFVFEALSKRSTA